MKLTGRQKGYVAILALALAALLVDRLILPAPDEAAAAHGAALAVTSTATGMIDPEALVAEVDVAVPRHVVIGRRLEALAEARGLEPGVVRDAFEPSPSWPLEGMGTGPAASVAERFKAAHVLTAVMASGPRGYAIIDGRTLFIGQSLDGLTLIAVGTRSATLESSEARVVLELPE